MFFKKLNTYKDYNTILYLSWKKFKTSSKFYKKSINLYKIQIIIYIKRKY